MARMSWKNPPPVVIIGGSEHYLREREIRNAVLHSARAGQSIVWADSDNEVVDALTMASTFGDSSLIIVPAKEVSDETVQQQLDEQAPKTCILLTHVGFYDEKRLPVIEKIHSSFRIRHLLPSKKRDKEKFALAFVKAESKRLMGGRKAIDTSLAEAVVRAAGTDVGTLAHELLKITLLAKARGASELSVEHVREMIRATSEIDIDPLRQALRARNGPRVAREMDRIRRNAGDVRKALMFILRGKGSASDLAIRWLRAALLLEKGASLPEMADRFSLPDWMVERDLIPGARRWGAPRLRELISNLARADRAIQLGAPSPWLACESALLIGCSG